MPARAKAARSARHSRGDGFESLDSKDTRALVNVRTSRMTSQVRLDDLTPQILAAEQRGRSGVPLHEQLEAVLRRLIQSGQVEPGVTIPGELELAAQLGLSRHTVRHA